MVVLVVDILKKEYRRGEMALGMRLAEIPSDLSELFKDSLRRDNENTDQHIPQTKTLESRSPCIELAPSFML